MPISGLLGVQFDMNLLGRLTCSVVGVLVISWAYRFYSSRGKATKPQHFVRRPPDRPAEAPRETCRNCKTELRPRNAGNHNTSDDGDKQHDEIKIRNVMFESTLKPCDASDSGLASPSQGQTHWILQRMQRGMAVGRELRQDLGIQGTFSSFLSKAEIRVEDANLVMQGHGDQSVVQGKIYEYYVESSSQSVTGSMVNHFERNSLDSQNVEFESGGSSPANPCMSNRDPAEAPHSGHVIRRVEPCHYLQSQHGQPRHQYMEGAKSRNLSWGQIRKSVSRKHRCLGVGQS
ncbi:hypothetical protein DPEC_G00206910 [Dallia pectoralis]|uniref:Uncharacterized protein n=1 Tax=Dallia pectoralis TaxID=75939 RepID=A0ACC2G4F5_DALPE|nr:hypothetical protein DPEC_G00206910 [Dallia pectoralis]